MTKEYLFQISDYSSATWVQSTYESLWTLRANLADFVASIGGAVASIAVASPLDVVKTRIQGAKFDSNISGMTIIRDMVRTEGVGAFFKGLTPKVIQSDRPELTRSQILVVGPKLVFSYTLAQSLIPFFGKYG